MVEIAQKKEQFTETFRAKIGIMEKSGAPVLFSCETASKVSTE
jgi:hypothetical protein